MTGTSAAYLHTNQSRSHLNHLVQYNLFIYIYNFFIVYCKKQQEPVHKKIPK